MAMTAEDIKKNVADANAAAAVAALEKQVAKSAGAYEAMNKSARGTAAQGAENIQNRMAAAGMERPMTETAGMILNTAAGEAIQSNRREQRLGAQELRANAAYLGAAGQKQADAMAQQQARKKAETLAQYGDFSGFSELGYSPAQVGSMKAAYDRENPKEEAFEGLGKYAQTLLDLYGTNAGFDIGAGLQEALDNGLITQRDYQAAMIASRGVVPGGNAKKTGSKTGGSPTADDSGQDPAYLAAQDAFSRVTEKRDGKYVVTNFGDWATLRNYFGNQLENSFMLEEERISTPLGALTYTEAEQLEQQGRLVMVGVDQNGDPIYSLPYSKNPYAVDMRK